VDEGVSAECRSTGKGVCQALHAVESGREVPGKWK
jgi:hypothetical protein